MPNGAKIWKRLRASFRWLRVGLLVFLLLAVSALLWFNFVGVPGFITSSLEEQLRGRHVNLEIEKIRLSGFNKLVGEGLRLEQTNNLPGVYFPRAEILFDLGNWRDFSMELRGLRVQDGRIDIPVLQSNQPPRTLVISNVITELEFHAPDTWELKQFEASALGGNARAYGAVTNVAEFRFSRTSTNKEAARAWQQGAAQLMDIVEQMQFQSAPEMLLVVKGDAARPSGLGMMFRFNAAGARSKWGTVETLKVNSAIFPGDTNKVKATFHSLAAGITADHGKLGKAEFRGEMEWSASMDRLLTNRVEMAFSDVQSDWARANSARALLVSSQAGPGENIQSQLTISSDPIRGYDIETGTNLVEAALAHPLPFPTPATLLANFLPVTKRAGIESSTGEISGSWHGETPAIATPRFVVENIHFGGSINYAGPGETIELNGLPEILARYRIPWEFEAKNIAAEKVSVGSLTAAGEWSAPWLGASNVTVQLYGGSLKGEMSADLRNGLVRGSAESQFDYHKGSGLLDSNVREWLKQFGWEAPPMLAGKFSFELPRQEGKWEAISSQLARSFQFSGNLAGAGSFRGIPADHVKSGLSFSNFIWRLPDLEVTRPEGKLFASYEGNVTNADFVCVLTSQIDPGALKGLLGEEAQKAFKMVEFKQPPLIRGRLAGNFDHEEQLSFLGDLAVTNLVVKGELISDVACRLAYSNLIVEAWDVVAHRTTNETATAPYMRMDIPAEVMWVTNVVSTVNPYIAMEIVGELKAIEPYQYAIPPKVIVNGNVPLKHWSKADLHFNVDGEQFSYWKFHMPRVGGDVYWKADHISFSNVVASFYGGDARWSGHFYINDQHSADFSFHATTTNSDLRGFMKDIVSGTNYMEGNFSGELVVTSANSDNPKSWNGYGSGTVSDGYLWNVPIFGVFTPVLDALTPGASLSRVKAATGTFTMTNTVLYTKDLEVRAPAFRLKYRGNVNLDGELDARVEAEILRDAWVFGKLVSTVLWPVSKVFEAKVSGTIESPETTLRYFPKFVFAPIKALGIMRDTVTGKSQEKGRSEPKKDEKQLDTPEE